MNKVFFFDVDGTLTPSRQPIDDSFRDFFYNFCKNNRVFLITGSDYSKTLEQLGEDICNITEGVYCCSGNELLVRGEKVKANDWALPLEAKEWLTCQLVESKFHLRTGNHFEHRPGTCNFSIVGRNANQEERTAYVRWDSSVNERKRIAREFNAIFTDIEALAGGETGLDISPKGLNKSQILNDFADGTFIFFGDRTEKGGNDYPLAEAVRQKSGVVYQVKDWSNCYEILKLYDSKTTTNY